MKSDIDTRMQALREQIAQLSPPESDAAGEVPDYDARLTILGDKLEGYLDFDSDADIPELVIEAYSPYRAGSSTELVSPVISTTKQPPPLVMRQGSFPIVRYTRNCVYPWVLGNSRNYFFSAIAA